MARDEGTILEQALSRMMERDLAGLLAMFAEDAVVYDPHYPCPTMEGQAAIERGLTWALDTLVKPGFEVRQMWMEGERGALEVKTHHVLKGGQEIDFEQVFLFETRDGLITHLRAFVPYRPPGIGGWIARMTGAWWRLRGQAS
jgi:ketosteroid isomerase-like protein